MNGQTNPKNTHIRQAFGQTKRNRVDENFKQFLNWNLKIFVDEIEKHYNKAK